MSETAMIHEVVLYASPESLVQQDNYLSDLGREFQLLRGHDGARPQDPAHVLEEIDALLSAYANERRVIRRQAEEALRHGHHQAEIRLRLPVEITAAAQRYMELMRKAWQLSEQGILLTMPPPSELREFQEAWVAQVIEAMESATRRPMRYSHDEAGPSRTGGPEQGEELVARFEAPDSTAARVARSRLASLLKRWHAEALSDVAELAVTELMTNAVLHAPGPVDVTAHCEDGLLQIAVTDTSPHPPVEREPDVDLATGRGLALIAALSEDWGWNRRQRGKTVWVRLRLPAEVLA